MHCSFYYQSFKWWNILLALTLAHFIFNIQMQVELRISLVACFSHWQMSSARGFTSALGFFCLVCLFLWLYLSAKLWFSWNLQPRPTLKESISNVLDRDPATCCKHCSFKDSFHSLFGSSLVWVYWSPQGLHKMIKLNSKFK